MTLNRALGFALATTLMMGVSAKADFVIDNFNSGSFARAETSNGGNSGTVIATGAGIIGGERELKVVRAPQTPTMNRQSVSADAGQNQDDLFTFSQDDNTSGVATLTYDGEGNIGFNEDITEGGVNTLFKLTNANSDTGGIVTVTIFSALDSSSVTGVLMIPGTDLAGTRADVSLDFTDFVGYALNPSIFANVGKIVIDVTGAGPGSDLSFNLIVASKNAVPEPTSLALLGMGLVGAGVRSARRRKAAR